MSSPSSQQQPSLRPLYTALLLITPLLALLPPRKLDLYTLSLGGLFIYSAQELAFGAQRMERGNGIRTGNTGVMGVLGTAQVDDASSVREGRLLPGERGGGGKGKGKEEGDGEIEGMRGLAKKLWMGDEKEGWQKRRLEREREELEGGKGYGDIIMEQVREVFPGFGGRRKEEDGEEEG